MWNNMPTIEFGDRGDGFMQAPVHTNDGARPGIAGGTNGANGSGGSSDGTSASASNGSVNSTTSSGNDVPLDLSIVAPMNEAEPGGRLAAKGRNTIAAVRRLIKELHLMQTDAPENTWARPKSMDNLLKWRAMIRGPSGSPYEQGIFEISINFSENYPFVPPIVRFTTPVYHCNVNTLGYICVDLMNQGACWTPGMTVDKMLLSMSSLLNDSDPQTAYNADAAKLYLENREQYDENAREWTRRHAMSATWGK